MLDEERRALETLISEYQSVAEIAETGVRKPEKKSELPELVIRQAAQIPPPAPQLKKLEYYSASTLYGAVLERPPIIIDNLIPAGLTVLAGAPKRGKSWMALKMALCISSGEPFLGMPTRKGPVLYLDLESKNYRVQDRLNKLIVGPAPRDLYFAHKSERLNSGLMEQLRNWIECVGTPAMIVIDTLGRVKGGARKGENAYESDTRIFGDLQSFALENKLSVVVVHHLKKDTGANDDYFERISGSMGLTGACDAVMVLAGKRGEETSTLRTSSRDFEAQDFVVRFNGGAWELVSCNSESYQEEQAYVQSPVVRGVIALMSKVGRFQGSAGELLTAICEETDEPLAMARANEFGKELNRFIVPLREKNGIRISMRRSGKNGKRVLCLENPAVCSQTGMGIEEDAPF